MVYERTESWRAFCERTGDAAPSTALFERVVRALTPEAVDGTAVDTVLADATSDTMIAVRIRAFANDRFQELLFGLARALAS